MARAKIIANTVMKWLAIVLVSIAVCLVVLVQVSQRVHRHKVERLVADFHGLRLKQSTWRDVQQVMARWGTYGNYLGQCSFEECLYTISLTSPTKDIEQSVGNFLDVHHQGFLLDDLIMNALSSLGGRSDVFEVSLLVENGVVVRSRAFVMLDVPPKHPGCTNDCYQYGIILSAYANDELGARDDQSWGWSDNQQLASHPFYKAGTRGACSGCVMFQTQYTPSIDPNDLQRLTSYDMSCFAGWRICMTPEDVLPEAARYLHRFHGVDTDEEILADSKPCNLPIFVLARDAIAVLVVQPLSSAPVPPSDSRYEAYSQHNPPVLRTAARLQQVLKGSSLVPLGSLIRIVPLDPPTGTTAFPGETLLPGKRYVLFPIQYPMKEDTEAPHCGVFEDSPAVEAEVRRGLALDDGAHFKQATQYPIW